jgi:hypothetical protein
MITILIISRSICDFTHYRLCAVVATHRRRFALRRRVTSHTIDLCNFTHYTQRCKLYATSHLICNFTPYMQLHTLYATSHTIDSVHLYTLYATLHTTDSALLSQLTDVGSLDAAAFARRFAQLQAHKAGEPYVYVCVLVDTRTQQLLASGTLVLEYKVSAISHSHLSFMSIITCLALPCLALPCLALPCLALPCLA